MLKLFFDFNVLYDILIGIGVFLLIFACLKYPSAKWFVSTVLVVVFIGFTVFCGVNLNYYYSAFGGIYGALGDLIQNNQLVSKELNMTVKNIVLTKDGNTDKYLAVCTTEDEYFNFDIDKKYMLLINDTPCLIKNYGSNYVLADFGYEFLDDELKSLFIDTLSLRFTFDNNIVTLKLYTNGGSTAVKYWNSYFSRNSMNINFAEISETDYTYYSDYVCVSVSNFFIDSYNKPVRTFDRYFIHSNSYFDYQKDIDGYEFLGYKFSLDDLSYIDMSSYVVKDNITLYACYEPIINYTLTVIDNTGYLSSAPTTSTYRAGSILKRDYFIDSNYMDSFGKVLGNGSVHLDSSTDLAWFLSIDDCGIISESEYNEHSAWVKYNNQDIGSLNGNSASYVVLGDNTFYVGYISVSCSCSVVVNPTPGSGGMSGSLA